MWIVKYIIEKRKPIAIVAILVTLLFYMNMSFGTLFSSGMVVSFIYPNSEKGQYPDLTRLNIYDIISDEVLEGAVAMYNEAKKTNLDPDDVKPHISVTEYVSPTVMDKVQSARSKGEDYSYFANEFTITCSAMSKPSIKDVLHLFGLIPNVDTKLLLDKLYLSYSDFFMNSHTEMNIIPRLATEIDYRDYDYLEIVSVFENKINMYIDYLEAKNSENGSFMSKTTGMTFNDLIVDLKNLKSLRVENLKGYVSASKIAKDNELFVNKLKAENENLNLLYQKAQGEADLAHNAMSTYDHTFEENIVITGMNDDIGLYQARPKTAYDTITKRALKFGVNASDLLKQIQENERLINLYSYSDVSPEEAQRMHGVIDSMTKDIETAFNQLTDDADKTVQDFLSEKSSEYLRKKGSSKVYLSIYILMQCGVAFALAAAAAMAGCLIYDQVIEYAERSEDIKAELKAKKDMLKKLATIQRGQKVSDVIADEYNMTNNESEGENK